MIYYLLNHRELMWMIIFVLIVFIGCLVAWAYWIGFQNGYNTNMNILKEWYEMGGQ